MDFSSLKQKLQDATKPLMEKAAPLLDKAKDAWYKALDFTQKQLQNTPLILKTRDEYIEVLTKKRCILISYDETDESSREILLRTPIWATKAFSDVAELRIAEVSRASELMREINVTTPIDMRVWYIGERTFHSTDIGEILKWWETRCYDSKTEEKWEISTSTETVPANNPAKIPDDPLEGK
jgi:hypothetical protein